MNKSISLIRTICNYLFLVILYLLLSFSVKAQTYTTIANGLWTSATSWQGGNIPPAIIPTTAVVNIKHCLSANVGGNITNYGVIKVSNTNGVSPRLIIPSGSMITNQLGGKIYVTNAEYRQYRFAGGGETGTSQNGSIINAGGYIEIVNSYIEIAEDFINQNMGIRVIRNSSINIGRDYKLTSNSFDSLQSSSVSVGSHGTGDFSTTGGTINFQSVRVEVASASGIFKINGSIANGDIDFITLKNHVNNTYSTGTITFSNSVFTTGLNLDAYCIANPANYISNGVVAGSQTATCSLNYFPATLFGSDTPGALNFSQSSVLISGPALQVGAIYKFEGIAPGIDALVKVDSLVNGATINKIDDNSGGLGYIEGFQPEIKAGPSSGNSYAVFTMSYMITGTSVLYPLATFDITALDIDGNSNLKEFDQIVANPGAVGKYMTSSTDITLTQVQPNAFNGMNIAGVERTGIDTASRANMFTVSSSNISSVMLKLGTVKTDASQPGRQYGIYFKGFVYPNLGSLPVKLKSFVATLDNAGNKADLKWATSSEINVSHFVIEKSNDGVHFSDLMLVFAKGTESSETNYSVSDEILNEKSKVIYYRLRTVDNDGNTQLSDIRLIRLSNSNEKKINIITYPNPVINELRITIPAIWQNKKVSFEVISVNGQTANKFEIANSSQTERINVNNLNPGVYIIRVSCEGQVLQQKVIKQ